MDDYLKAVIFVPPEIRANPQIMPRAVGDIVSSEKELIDRISNQRDLIGLAQLSGSFAPRLELGDMKWSRTVNLVVGESFTDAVWNARHFTPALVNGGIVSLKVSMGDLADADRFDAIVKIIKNRIIFPSEAIPPTYTSWCARRACRQQSWSKSPRD